MEGYLTILFVLLALSSSSPRNNTSSHTQNQTDFSKRGFSLGGGTQLLLGRQTSVFATKFIEFLEKKIPKYGTVKIKIWNMTPENLEDAKWKDENLAVEIPPSKTVESQKGPVEIVAHYMKIAVLSRSHSTLWVSYKISLTHRVCIYVKLREIFEYTVYITGNHLCDEPQLHPPENVFVSENEGNGYKSYWQHITAECAIASHEQSHRLNVYILNVDETLPALCIDGQLQAWTDQTQWPNLNQVIILIN